MMERRMERHRQMSPDRAKVRTQKSPKHGCNHHYDQHELRYYRSVPVVYYLCRDRQLEHPHFMEVHLSSSNGLSLKDVIDRLSVLRGRRVVSMYSWSCKRSYKNGYVWHDLCDDDLISPVHGNEYILKGSELFEESSAGQFSPSGTQVLQNQKALPEPPSARSLDESSSLPSLNGRSTKSSLNDELSPRLQHPCSLNMFPEYSIGKNSSWNGSSSLIDYKAHNSERLADASTQTDEKVGRVVESEDTCTGGVLIDGTSAPGTSCSHQSHDSPASPELCRDFGYLPLSSDQTYTLESLIQADMRKLNSLRVLEKEGSQMPSCTKLKALNMIMHLISCGSTSVKDQNFGLIPTYRPVFSGSKFAAPLFSTSFTLGEADCVEDNPRTVGMRLEDKEYFSRNTAMIREDALNLKQSDCGRSTQQLHPTEAKGGKSLSISNFPVSKMTRSPNKQPLCKSARSPLSEQTRMSSERVEGSQINITSVVPPGRIRRMATKPVSVQEQSRKGDSLANDDESVIRIEERLASGARVVIQTKLGQYTSFP